ncbi:MAG TPA: nucleotidyltransferase family protein, partial [Candidatus Omnitrophota bacterium]|nr:nucleotidyltransferase family protein [Candidatus Omnitrophota bacterium]HQJ15714.1 nucleotidyltransferase family protein [Candidatus Omnitrophota bacterium]
MTSISHIGLIALDKAPEQFILSVLKGGKHSAKDDLPPGLLSGEVFWHDVLVAAVREGVFYPFYKGLLASDHPRSIIPESIRERYRQTYYLHAAKSSVSRFQVSRVLSCLESRTIDVLLFKGPAVDSAIYDDFMRPRLDIDIAARDFDMAALEEALCENGYKAPSDPAAYPLPEYLNSRLFVPVAEDLVPVHVHRHLINNMFLTVDNMPCLDMGKVWQETVAFRDYRHIRALKPEMNILFLCEHALKHDFDQLVYLYEIGQLMSVYRRVFDWQKLRALADGSGLGRAVYCSLYLVKKFFDGDIPAEGIEAFKPSLLTRGEKKFLGNALALRRSRYASFSVYLAMRRGILRKIYFTFRTVFPPHFGFRSYLERIRKAIKR